MEPPGGRGDRRVRFSQQEQFRGILVPLAAGSLDRPTLPGLQQLNQALKRRAGEPATNLLPGLADAMDEVQYDLRLSRH